VVEIFHFKGEEHMIIFWIVLTVLLCLIVALGVLYYHEVIRLITFFGIVSIVISILFVVMAILCYNGILSEEMHLVTLILGVLVAVLNIISMIGWWMTNDDNSYNENQLRINRMLGGH